ncbi:hypothetical protein A2U01_0070154, partial [Trifolium medium]|nr:hypothetical protein [Trifolium medium]
MANSTQIIYKETNSDHAIGSHYE